MRIIAGEHKGRRLKTPEGMATRPTTDRVREALMSMLANARGSVDLEGAVVLDAFAGSGSLGLEALSRGASRVDFFECRRDAYQVLCDNVKTLGYEKNRACTHFADVLAADLRLGLPFNVVLLDPPYALEARVVFDLINRADQSGALASDVVVSYEHDPADSAATDAQIDASDFIPVSRHRYAGVMVNILKRKDA